MLSKDTFQCGTWPDLPDPQYKRFHSCLLGIYRNASGNYYRKPGHEDFDVAAMFNDDDVVYTYRFLCPRTILRMGRLLLFIRVVVKSPPLILGLVLAQASLKKG